MAELLPSDRRWLIAMTVLLYIIAVTSASQSVQHQLSSPHQSRAESQDTGAVQKLHGKFLHITDIHPDPFYRTHTLTDEEGACHRGDGTAGHYGAELSSCDAPFSLVNATFKWIQENLKDSIDFVIWTGDNARHDNDEKFPRNNDQVAGLNQQMVDKMVEVFWRPDDKAEGSSSSILRIPIVPNFGNNDILPHNIFYPGPNKFTKEYLSIWRDFIPEAQRHGFERGGWFWSEVIPDRLAVFSLNSLYFFDANAAVDGCAARSQPGYDQFEWLRAQLDLMRERGMKAILTGHVPPARTKQKTTWDETCWQKYTLWVHQYRDVIVGSIWGHMNIDHFMFQDSKDVDIAQLSKEMTDSPRGDLSAAASSEYMQDLRIQFSKLPSPPSGANVQRRLDKKLKRYHKMIGGEFGERYAVSMVGPSIIPNYFPSLRVIEYNTSGLDSQSGQPGPAIPAKIMYTSPDSTGVSNGHKSGRSEKQAKKHPKFHVPDGPSGISPPGPAYSMQPLTFTGYTQLFANLTTINNDFSKGYDKSDDVEIQKKWKKGKHHGEKSPHSSNPKEFKFETLYSTFNDTLFKVPDLTVRSYLIIAHKIGRGASRSSDVDVAQADGKTDDPLSMPDSADGTDLEVEEGHKKHKKREKHHHKKSHNKAWFLFLKRAFVGAVEDEDIEEIYGAFPPVER